MFFGCLHFEQIRKANVDHLSCSGMIPKCELLLRWLHKDKPHVCLEHDIELTGVKDLKKEQNVARTLHSTSLMLVRDIKWYEHLHSFLRS